MQTRYPMDSKPWLLWLVPAAVVIVAPFYFIYEDCRIDVPTRQMAILTHKTGKDLEPGMVIAPAPKHKGDPVYKGVQQEVLNEGRYYYNPYDWEWEVVPQIEIPKGKLGVRIRLYGEDLPAGELIATQETQKGIVRDVLMPGRYAINGCLAGKGNPRSNCAEIIELHDPVTIEAGFKGVLTELTGPLPQKANEVLSGKGERGVQKEALNSGTYYLNPYVQEVRMVDCRSQRINLTDIGFPTKDGFWVSLEAIIEFQVKPEGAAKAYVLFSERT